MEKIFSKELLLQNLNSTNLFVAKDCMYRIFDELLKGKQGLLSMQDIIFSQKSGICPEEFLKNFGRYFTQLSERDMAKWDNFFNVLEERRSYMSISRMVVLEMYLHDNLSKKEKHRCCFWLNNHCQLGNHQELILKMLSYPEDGKLLLLAKKYCRQEFVFSQEELDKICSLPARVPRKLEIFALFISQRNQNFNFCILKNLMQNLADDNLKATGNEKQKMWMMFIGLLQTNPVDEVVTELDIDVKIFNAMYDQGKIEKDIYMKILRAFAEQIVFIPAELKYLLDGYEQVVFKEKNRNLLNATMGDLFFLLDKKKPRITDKILILMLKIASFYQDKMWFKVEYWPKFRAKIYQAAMLVQKANLSMLKQCLKLDENLFLMLVPQVEEPNIKSLLRETMHHPELWQKTLDALLSKTLTDIMPTIKILAELYKAENTQNGKQMLAESLNTLLNNLPEKEIMVENAEEEFAFMMDNTDLKNLADNYLKKAKEPMADYLIG